MQALVIVIIHMALDASSTLGVSHPGGGGSGCGRVLNAGGSGGRVVHAGCHHRPGGGGRMVGAGWRWSLVVQGWWWWMLLP